MSDQDLDLAVEWNPSMLLEVTLDTPDDFLKVKETLTRIGIASQREEKTLYQSCHILHKQGRYFIVHFKEMFLLDGKLSDLCMGDLARRNTIAILLSDWGLLTLVDKTKAVPTVTLKNIKIIPFKEKKEWKLLPKYAIGQVKKNK